MNRFVRTSLLYKRSSLLGLIAFGLVATIVAGCKFKPPNDMEEQPNIHPAYKPSEAFEDGSSARPVPYGTVARASLDSPGSAYVQSRTVLPAMADSLADVSAIPFPVTRQVLLRGQQRFNIYCSMCHGRVGDGNGMIVQRGMTPPPSFHIDRLRQVSDGHIYNVISNGYGQMFSYNDRVKPEDRWMIVAYIRALQASTDPQNHVATLTEEDRVTLRGVRP